MAACFMIFAACSQKPQMSEGERLARYVADYQRAFKQETQDEVQRTLDTMDIANLGKYTRNDYVAFRAAFAQKEAELKQIDASKYSGVEVLYNLESNQARLAIEMLDLFIGAFDKVQAGASQEELQAIAPDIATARDLYMTATLLGEEQTRLMELAMKYATKQE